MANDERIYIRVRADEKAAFAAAAAVDELDLSSWLRWTAATRIAELQEEGKLKPDGLPVAESDAFVPGLAL
jgi:hypothetical protein